MAADASDNTVDITYNTATGKTQQKVNNGPTVDYDGNTSVFGGYTDDGNANNNKVNIYGGQIDKNVHGGYTDSGNANGNNVTVYDGTLNQDLRGGTAHDGNATYNTVNFYGGWLGEAIYGGSASAYVDGDSVQDSSASADVTGNTVNIYGGQLAHGMVYGGVSEAIVRKGNGSAAATATGNTINICGGQINNAFYGGYAYAGTRNGLDMTGNASAAATGNTINICGGQIAVVDVYGGLAKAVSAQGTAEALATGNTVNILAPVTLKNLYGGYATITTGYNQTDNYFEGIGTIDDNTLNLFAKDVKVDNVCLSNKSTFQNMNFFLPRNTAAGDTMLTINSDTNLTGVNFGLAAQSGLKLKVGDTVTLITTGSNALTLDSALEDPTTPATPSIPNSVKKLTVATGISTDTTYTFSIQKQGDNALISTVTSSTYTGADEEDNGGGDNGNGGNGGNSGNNNNSNNGGSKLLPERTKSLTETRAGMASLLNGGTDLILGQGFAQAELAASENSSSEGTAGSGGSFAPFAALGGSSMRAKSGSHVDSKSLGINLGFAKKFENRQGSLLVGPIFEYGHGNYDSYLDSGIHGSGNSTFYGGGLFAKQTNHDGLYFEGSLRGGHMKADYSANLAPGLNANYDTGSSYFAAHLGIGKVFAVKNGDSVDAYLKYFFSHTGSDDVTIHSNLNDERYHFDSVDSSRIRLGFRYNHPLNDKSKLYAGLAWQYEFDGEARATYNGMSTPSPSLKGSSGMAELGWQVKPSEKPLTLDLSVTGWAGKQQGVTASLKVNWEF